MSQLPSQDALVSALTKSNRKVSVLVGSPLSMSDKAFSPGVPGVDGVLEIILSFLRTEGLESKYLSHLDRSQSSEKYQNSFAFVRDWVGQDAVNDVVRTAVKKARVGSAIEIEPFKLDRDIEGWYLPAGTKALGDLISSQEKFSGTLLTTNFDPLLAVSIAKAGCTPIQTVLHVDGKLDQQQMLNPDCRSIVHLHGYWHDSDTLHTPDQLMANRPSLKASLRRLLAESMLLVVGYGGWDDVFMEALSELMFDERAPLDVLWAFRESDRETVSNKYKKILEKVGPAISRGRFRMYGGINCNVFFPYLFEQMTLLDNEHHSATIKINNIKDGDDSKQRLTLSVNSSLQDFDDVFTNSDSEGLFSSIDNLKNWIPRKNAAHKYVRAVEQDHFFDAMNKSRIVYLSAEWGMGKDGFIYSILDVNGNSIDKLYRVSIDDIDNRVDLTSAAESQLGADLQNFAVTVAKESDVTLIIDGVSPSKQNDDWINVLSSIAYALVDFSPDLKIILCGRSDTVDLNCPVVKLEILDEADISAYIKEHVDGSIELSKGKGLDVLSRLSGGLPIRLDSLLDDLTIMSIDELVDFESEAGCSVDNNIEPMPPALDRSIIKLSTTVNDSQKRSFFLLEVLSVLEFGESFSSIKRFNDSRPFHLANIRELHDLGLINSASLYSNSPSLSNSDSSSQEELAKLHSVQPLVRERVLGMLEEEDMKKIVARATDLTFGNRWREAQFKLSSAATQHLTDSSRSGVGNAHLLALKMLKYAIEENNEVGIKRAFSICAFYCKLLEVNNRYRDLVSAVNEVLMVSKMASCELDLASLLCLLGKGMRMLGQWDAAIPVLEEALTYRNLIKSQKISAYLNIALAQKSLKDTERSVSAANEVVLLSRKSSSSYIHASKLIIDSGSKNVGELVSLEKIARKKKFNSVANTILLELARVSLDKERKLKLYTDVISYSSDPYNQNRAVVRKAQLLSKNPELGSLNYQENIILIRTYEYGFSQKMSDFFNDSLCLLWDKFEEDGNSQSLLQIFRYSSLFWRLKGDVEKESVYAGRLSRYIKEEKKNGVVSRDKTSIRKYVIVRLRFLLVKSRAK
ncbi:SIR2 family protein [Pseudoalteromonas distincta]|uniref:SIR2 family protein n=1 Tax=Pseudoalteromonas distincta TaxID=77608 RepID=UPI0030015AD7